MMDLQMDSPDPREDDGPDLVFISQVGPIRPKDTRTQIRKHVMLNIGKARRRASLQHNPSPVPIQAKETIANTDSLAPELSERPEKDKSPGRKDDRLSSHMLSKSPHPKVKDSSSKTRAAPSAAKRPQKSRSTSLNSWLWESSRSWTQVEHVWTGRLDPFFKYPVEVDDKALKLLDHLLDDRYGNTPPFRDLWLPVGLLDPAGFYQMICNAIINLSSLCSKALPAASLQAMCYHAKAIQSINERISDVAVLKSDGFLATIIGLACYYHATGDLDGWRLHRDGAAEIIRLRGGVDTIERNPQLGILFFWTENAGAITLDVPPLSPIPYKLLPPLLDLDCLSTLSPQALQVRNAWTWFLPDQPQLMRIMNEMRGFTTYLRSQAALTSGKVYSHGLTAASYMVPILHKLLLLAAPDVDALDERKNFVQAVRLSCCLFFSEIRRLFGIMGVQTALQTAKLRRLLEASADAWAHFGLLKVWCIAVGGFESIGEQRAWYRAELEKGKEELGLDTWEDVLEELRGIAWYESIHDTSFRDFSTGSGRDECLQGESTHGGPFEGYRPDAVRSLESVTP